jgi:hypothetical protein
MAPDERLAWITPRLVRLQADDGTVRYLGEHEERTWKQPPRARAAARGRGDSCNIAYGSGKFLMSAMTGRSPNSNQSTMADSP